MEGVSIGVPDMGTHFAVLLFYFIYISEGASNGVVHQRSIYRGPGTALKW